jgi:malate dehydrogenase (oxaloacetate-decarboxylating)(NADP+)
MTDSKGVLWKGRGDEGGNPYKDKYFRDTTARTLADAVRGADVFCGLSLKGLLTKEMVRTMADRPIIFAMANPDPEITYEDAKEARPDAIVATGRSDYPNQVNNVLGFPFIFRGALDVEATAINEEMKMAASQALARLAREEVPESVKRAYSESDITFGPEYIIPKPFDHRVLVWSSSAVAEAAMRTGVARKIIDLEEYKEQLMEKVDWSREAMRKIFSLARRSLKRIVFPEGDDPKVIWAANELAREGIVKPVLLGKSKEEILAKFEELRHSPEGIEIIEPKKYPLRDEYIRKYYEMHQRRGVTMKRAAMDMRDYYHFGAMMVREGQADGMVAGVEASYPEVLRPAMDVVGMRQGGRLVAGMYMLLHEHRLYCMADCVVNINPNAEDLAEIALMSAAELELLEIDPKIALLSFSTFGSVQCEETEKVIQAVELIKLKRPDLVVDGPLQADVALDPEFLLEYFPFSNLKTKPNLMIFPNLDAGSISLRLLRKLSNAHTIGPVTIGLAKPIEILPRGADVNAIINLAAIASVNAQEIEKKVSREEVMEQYVS